MGTPPSAPPLSSKRGEGAGEGEGYCRFQNQFVAQIESPLGKVSKSEADPGRAYDFCATQLTAFHMPEREAVGPPTRMDYQR